MLTMQTTLLVGPADWQPARMPKEVFLERIESVWKANPHASGLIVYGDRAHHADLTYLTHFTPKLEAALALIPRDGEAQLLVGGGVNMLQAARPLTYIEELRPLRDVGKSVRAWAQQHDGTLILIGGALMPYPMRQELDETLGKADDQTAHLRVRMRRKDRHELAAIREACACLDAAVKAMRTARRRGDAGTAVVLAGEHAAQQRGAQDVRSLFSSDGGRSLRPFEAPIEHSRDPLLVYLAVRQLGYWAEAFVLLSSTAKSSHGGTDAVPSDVLAAVTDMLKPGERCADVAKALARLGMSVPSVAIGHYGNGIGLALEEQPAITPSSEDVLAPGDVLSMHVQLSGREAPIVSAMVALGASATEVLWSSSASFQ
ncbi:MAG: M24 family metallopeptidase [Xanthobacteraceae bacterium]